jgi:hypothetical protein
MVVNRGISSAGHLTVRIVSMIFWKPWIGLISVLVPSSPSAVAR